MKHVVMMNELKGSDIRPPSTLSMFRKISIEDSQRYFKNRAALIDIQCPACGCSDKKSVFEKYEFQYNQCSECRSLFVSPRPSEEMLTEYFENSRASQIKSEYLIRETAEARRFHVLRGRAYWIGRIVDEKGKSSARSYADIGTNYPELFDEINKLNLFEELQCVKPFPKTDLKQLRNLATINYDWPCNMGAISAFEQLENQFSPHALIQSAHNMLAADGILFLTTRSVSGFDLQCLWDKTPYIFVPEHLNLLSIEGLEKLLLRSGFKLLELSTPGQLDVELVKQTIQEDLSCKLPPFIDYLLKHRDIRTHIDFQMFLQKNLLSSHVRIAAIKKEADDV